MKVFNNWHDVVDAYNEAKKHRSMSINLRTKTNMPNSVWDRKLKIKEGIELPSQNSGKERMITLVRQNIMLSSIKKENDLLS